MTVIKKTKTFSKSKTKSNSRKRFNKSKKNRYKTSKMVGGEDGFHLKQKPIKESFYFTPKRKPLFTVEHLEEHTKGKYTNEKKKVIHEVAHSYLNGKKEFLTPDFFKKYKSLQNAPSHIKTTDLLTELFTVPVPNPKNPFNTPKKKIFVNDLFINYLHMNQHKIAELLDHQETKQEVHNYIKNPEIEKHFTPDFFKKYENVHSDTNNINNKLNNLFSHPKPNPNNPGEKFVSDEFINKLKKDPKLLKELLEEQHNEHKAKEYFNSKKTFLTPEFFEKYNKITDFYENLKQHNKLEVNNITFKDALNEIFSHPENKAKTFVNKDFITYLETNLNPNLIVNLLQPHYDKSKTLMSTTTSKQTNPQPQAQPKPTQYYTNDRKNRNYPYATANEIGSFLIKKQKREGTQEQTQLQIDQQKAYNNKLKEYFNLNNITDSTYKTSKKRILNTELKKLAQEYRTHHGEHLKRFDGMYWRPYTKEYIQKTYPEEIKKYGGKYEEEKQSGFFESHF